VAAVEPDSFFEPVGSFPWGGADLRELKRGAYGNILNILPLTSNGSTSAYHSNTRDRCADHGSIEPVVEEANP